MISDEQLNSMDMSEMRVLEARLSKRIELVRQKEKQETITQVRELVVAYGLVSTDIFNRPGRAQSTLTGMKVAAKYRDRATGLTWSGRGKPPRWLNGKNPEEFLIQSQPA